MQAQAILRGFMDRLAGLGSYGLISCSGCVRPQSGRDRVCVSSECLWDGWMDEDGVCTVDHVTGYVGFTNNLRATGSVTAAAAASAAALLNSSVDPADPLGRRGEGRRKLFLASLAFTTGDASAGGGGGGGADWPTAD